MLAETGASAAARAPVKIVAAMALRHRRAVRLVGLPSPYEPPMSRFRATTHTAMMPKPEKPFYHRSIKLAPPVHGSRMLAYRAPIRAQLDEKELRAAPPAASLLDSDGVPVTICGRRATHSFAVSCRTSIVSGDWVHAAHESPVRSWRLRFPVAFCESGDIFVGCTEASSFEHPGRTVVFDCRGSMRAGFHPLNMFHRFGIEDVKSMEGAEASGSFCSSASAIEVKVTIDLTVPERASMCLEFSNGDRLVYPIDNFEHARLCVSLRCVGDVVELC